MKQDASKVTGQSDKVGGSQAEAPVVSQKAVYRDSLRPRPSSNPRKSRKSEPINVELVFPEPASPLEPIMEPEREVSEIPPASPQDHLSLQSIPEAKPSRDVVQIEDPAAPTAQTKPKKETKKGKFQMPLIDDLNSSGMKLNRTLKESGDYNYFLLKVAFEFLVFYLVLSAVCVYTLLNVQGSRNIYNGISMKIWLWVLLAGVILIKVAGGFFARRLGGILKLLWLLDMVASASFTFGLYYFIQANIDTPQQLYSPFVVIVVINLFCAMCGFLLSTFYHSRTRRYNFYLGWAIMSALTTVVSLVIKVSWQSVIGISDWQWALIAIGMAIHNAYIVLEAYFMVTRRAMSLREHDSLRAFYSVFTDVYFRFWKDVAAKMKKHLAMKDSKDAKARPRTSRANQQKPQGELGRKSTIKKAKN